MTKVLAKEVGPFNIRVLTVVLGTFNTNMGNAVVLGKNPIPADYNGSVAAQMLDIMSSGKFTPDGDKDKAMKVVYEVVVGEGVGEGRESEKFLPLGRDITPRLVLIQGQMAHGIEVFGEVCNNVFQEKK